MIYDYKIDTHVLRFKRQAKTSRNIFDERTIHSVTFTDLKSGETGTGEAAPLRLLSIDDTPDYLGELHQAARAVSEGAPLDSLDLRLWPSIRFGLECALIDLRREGKPHFNNSFTRRERTIPINGLVWMNDIEQMRKEASEKIEAGFSCIKIKVGALDFDSECRMLEHLRKQYSAQHIELRLDANGAFDPDEAKEQLKELKRFEIHSIEQPVKARHWDSMANLTRAKLIDIALDEELIAWPLEKVSKMLEELQPQYIILKPNLIGGLQNSSKWITEAEDRGIGWWATSALESNIGLNFIAQWVGNYNPRIPQGLGTGSLYEKNFDAPLEIIEGEMHFRL